MSVLVDVIGNESDDLKDAEAQFLATYHPAR
jgi:hypothetical protein